MLTPRLIAFKKRYGFVPKKELAFVYWALAHKLLEEGKLETSHIAACHAMRCWPDIINHM